MFYKTAKSFLTLFLAIYMVLIWAGCDGHYFKAYQPLSAPQYDIDYSLLGEYQFTGPLDELYFAQVSRKSGTLYKVYIQELNKSTGDWEYFATIYPFITEIRNRKFLNIPRTKVDGEKYFIFAEIACSDNCLRIVGNEVLQVGDYGISTSNSSSLREDFYYNMFNEEFFVDTLWLMPR